MSINLSKSVIYPYTFADVKRLTGIDVINRHYDGFDEISDTIFWISARFKVSTNFSGYAIFDKLMNTYW